jgi:hypothetical protein
MTEYTLAAVCPECGRRPRIRLYPATILRYADVEPDEPVMSYRCHVDGCHAIYPLAAVAIQFAIRTRKRDAA